MVGHGCCRTVVVSDARGSYSMPLSPRCCRVSLHATEAQLLCSISIWKWGTDRAIEHNGAGGVEEGRKQEETVKRADAIRSKAEGGQPSRRRKSGKGRSNSARCHMPNVTRWLKLEIQPFPPNFHHYPRHLPMTDLTKSDEAPNVNGKPLVATENPQPQWRATTGTSGDEEPPVTRGRLLR